MPALTQLNRISRDYAAGNDDDIGFVIGSGMDLKLSERFSLGMKGLYYPFENDRTVFFENGDRVAGIDSDNATGSMHSSVSTLKSPPPEVDRLACRS